MTAAATTGPASGPLPASSQPATGNSPCFIAYRSRLKVGRTISSPNGRRAAAVRLIAAILARIACQLQFRRDGAVKVGDKELSGQPFSARPRESGDPTLGPWIPACPGMSGECINAGDQTLMENPAGIDRHRLPGHRLGTAHRDDLIGAIVLVGRALEQRTARRFINLGLRKVRGRAVPFNQAGADQFTQTLRPEPA